MDEQGASGDEHCCKVGRVAAAYALEEVETQLLDRQADGASLRDLADFFNRRVFVGAVDVNADRSVGDADLLYERLTDPATSSGREAELRTRLERAGVPVDAVEDAFVSYVTVRNHLRSCRAVDTSRPDPDPESARQHIGWIRSKSTAVVDDKLDQLRAAGELQTGPLTVTQTIHVRCEDCGELYRLDDLLGEQACRCEADTTEGRPKS